MYIQLQSKLIKIFKIKNYSESSFESVDMWLKELKTKSSPDIKIFLIGNKLDLENQRKITKEKGEAIKNDYNLDLFVECSARDGRNTEYIFVQAAKLLYTDYIKYKIGNPLIGKKSGVVFVVNL